MFGFLLSLFVIVCFLLVLVVLMQSGRGGGLSGAFGGGGNQTVFGGRGAVDFLGKATWILGSAFMTLALILAVLSASDDGGGKSLIPKRSGAVPLAPLSSPTSGEAIDPFGDSPASPAAEPAPATETAPATPDEGADAADEPGTNGQ